MVLERILLQTIKFDLQVEHPYQFLLKYAKQLKGKGVNELSIVKSSLCNDGPRITLLKRGKQKSQLCEHARDTRHPDSPVS